VMPTCRRIGLVALRRHIVIASVPAVLEIG
jgi:hypothetical protein